MTWWFIGIGLYIGIGYWYAEMYRMDCDNNIEEEFEKGAYRVALFLWLAVLVYALFDREEEL